MQSFELPTEERSIDGVRFRFTKLPFKESRATLLLLSNKVFPAIKSGLAGLDGADKDDFKAKIGVALVSGLGSLFERLGEADLEQLEETFGKYCEHAPGGYDESGDERWVRLHRDARGRLFGGGRMALYTKWLIAAVEVSFADFFAELRGLASRAPSS